jgi:cardiolipin synthase
MPATLASRLRDGGVRLEVFRPVRGFKLARRHLRRLHRKMAVIDDNVAFVGGINIIDDHNYGPLELPEVGPRYDFAVRVRGPLVAQIALASARLWFRMAQQRGLRETATAFAEVETLTTAARQARREHHAGGVAAALLLRDNLRNRRTIEREYLYALGAARHDVIIANAYFLPGTKMRRALLACRERGCACDCCCRGWSSTGCNISRRTRCTRGCSRPASKSTNTRRASCTRRSPSSTTRGRQLARATWIRSACCWHERPTSRCMTRALPACCARLERAMAQRSARVVPEVHARLPRLRRFANWAAYYVLRLGVVIAGVTGRY